MKSRFRVSETREQAIMSNEVLIYIIIFLVCVLITGGVLTFDFLTKKSLPSQAPDTVVVYVETPSSETVNNQPEFDEYYFEPTPETKNTPPDLNDLTPEEQLFLELQKQLQNIYRPTIEPLAEMEINIDYRALRDSLIITDLMKNIDELHNQIVAQNDDYSLREQSLSSTYKDELSTKDQIIQEKDQIIQEMERKMAEKDRIISAKDDTLKQKDRSIDIKENNITLREKQIDELRSQVRSLNNIISGLRKDIYNLKNTITVVSEPDYLALAKLYNNMNAKKVASLLQNMPPEQSVNILKLMTSRKRAQVMTVLPVDVGTHYSNLMIIKK